MVGSGQALLGPAVCRPPRDRVLTRSASAQLVYTPRVVDSREETLRFLVEIASSSDTSSCFNDDRAAALLRSESTEEELRGLGVDEALIEWIWQERA